MKKTQGHIEVILSFTIFIGFLMAIFYFLSPISTNRISYSSLDRVEEKLLQNLSIEYKEVSLIIKDPRDIGGDCFSVNNSVGFSENTIIKDEDGNIAKSSTSNSEKKITVENKNSTIYHIYSSSSANEFNDYPIKNGCLKLDESNYSFSAPITNRLVLFENLEAMDKAYPENYDNIKANLSLEDDFEFIVYNMTRGILMNDTVSVHKIKLSSVLSRDILLRSIDKNASSGGLILNLRVW